RKKLGMGVGLAALFLTLAAGAESTDPAIRRALEHTEMADNSGEQMQTRQLNRIVEQAGAHRLPMELKQRAGIARAEVPKAQRLEEDLQQARELAARQRV